MASQPSPSRIVRELPPIVAEYIAAVNDFDADRIVDTFTKQTDVPRYARMVSVSEIADPRNYCNLNLPRYIDTSEPEDLQDIDGFGSRK